MKASEKQHHNTFEELAINLFCATQVEEKLKRENIKNIEKELREVKSQMNDFLEELGL